MVAWYKQNIPQWMDQTGDLPDGAYRAFHVIRELIFLHEGPIRLHEQGIAGKCNQHILAFRNNLKILLTQGRLTLNPDRTLGEPTAYLALESIGRNRVAAGLGGRAKAKALENKRSNVLLLTDSSAHKTRLEETRLESKIAARAAPDSFFTKSENIPPAPKRENEPPDAIVYREGRAILGPSAGGLIRKLIEAKNGSFTLARATLLQASTKGPGAREYIGGVIRKAAAESEEREDGCRDGP